MPSHLLNRGIEFALLVESLRLEAVEREVRLHAPGQFVEANHVPANTVNAEKRRLRTFRLDRYERRPVLREISAQHRRQFFDGGSLKQSGERQGFAVDLLNAVHQSRRQQRVPAKIEEILLSANRPATQQFFPDSD